MRFSEGCYKWRGDLSDGVAARCVYCPPPPPPRGRGLFRGLRALVVALTVAGGLFCFDDAFLGTIDNSTNEPLSLWERGWGEGSNQLKNRNFDSSMIAHPLPGPPPGPTQNASAFCVGTRPQRAGNRSYEGQESWGRCSAAVLLVWVLAPAFGDAMPGAHYNRLMLRRMAGRVVVAGFSSGGRVCQSAGSRRAMLLRAMNSSQRMPLVSG